MLWYHCDRGPSIAYGILSWVNVSYSSYIYNYRVPRLCILCNYIILFCESSYRFLSWGILQYPPAEITSCITNESEGNKGFYKCLVTGSKHSINETNPFLGNAFLNFYTVTSVHPEVTCCDRDLEGLKSVLLGVCPPSSEEKEWGLRECFTDKIKRIWRMRERREVEYIFHVIRERWSARKKIPLQLRQLQNCCCVE